MRRAITPETIRPDDFPGRFRDAAREIAECALARGYEVSHDASEVLSATDEDLRTAQLLNRLVESDVVRWTLKEKRLIEARQHAETAMSRDLQGDNSQTESDVAG